MFLQECCNLKEFPQFSRIFNYEYFVQQLTLYLRILVKNVNIIKTVTDCNQRQYRVMSTR